MIGNRIGLGVVLTVAGTTLSMRQAAGQTVRNYDVNRTTTAPAIDGVVSPGEWDAAAVAAGDWRELRKDESDVDTENNRFRMMWDDTNLYILYETNFGTYFPPINKVENPNPTMNFSEDSLNLYFDPNTNGDPNFTVVPESNVDGYQLAFNQYRDPDGGTLISTNANRQGVGFFTEAHVNTPFGDQAFWNDVDKDGVRDGADVDGAALQDIIVAQTNGTSGGVTEIVFPWTNFNALGQLTLNAGTPEEEVIDTGLFLSSAPSGGDQWFFNVGRINGDPITSGENFLPIWNWKPDQSFATRPHGTLTFLGGASLGGDLDGDGDVDGADFLLGQQGEDFPAFFAEWEANFGTTGATFAAVPEPTVLMLALSGAALCAGRRRRTVC